MEKKILVAVDGSVHSYNTLRYLSYLFTDLEDVFVHLFCVVPSGGIPLGHDWVDPEDRMLTLRPETMAKMRAAKRFMQEAVLQLGRRGIAPEQVSTDVKLSRISVTQDICLEARQGYYDALVIGRRGLTKIEEFIMGSVSAEVAQKCYDLPIWIVDGKVNSRRFLLPVDQTFNSLKAADHLGHVLSNNPYAEITLFHMSKYLWGSSEADMEELATKWGEEWCRDHLQGIDSLYHAPEQILVDRGFPKKRIKRLSKVSGLGAPRKIIEHSVIDKCGTIVIGRRSSHKKKGLFKGVSEQVLAMAEHVAVWVVG